MNKKLGCFTVLLAFSGYQTVQANWWEIFSGGASEVVKSEGAEIAKSALSNSEVVSGLKEALANGVETAIKELGRPGGFLGNHLVQISLPDSLQTLAGTARTLGQGQYVDSFETTMNQAAEKAVPAGAEILADAIRKMSVDDAMSILNGSDNAATQYFRKVSEKALMQEFKPIVNEATNQSGATLAYKNLLSTATPLLGGMLEGSNLDLDQYVTQKSLDGLFKYIGIQEQKIRSNPAARGTELLKKVFGQ